MVDLFLDNRAIGPDHLDSGFPSSCTVTAVTDALAMTLHLQADRGAVRLSDGRVALGHGFGQTNFMDAAAEMQVFAEDEVLTRAAGLDALRYFVRTAMADPSLMWREKDRRDPSNR